MINYDYYVVARKISKRLKSMNLEEWSDKINEAIDSGSTGTEIFMVLRWNIDQFLDSGINCPDELKNEIIELRIKLDEALNK